jgi:phosphatidate phosphatase PAH1
MKPCYINEDITPDLCVVNKNELSKFPQIELSLCYSDLIKNTENAEEIFYKNLITKSDFFKDPWKVINNSNLLIKYQHRVYTYKTAAPLLFSLLAFNEQPPENVIKQLSEEKSIFSFLGTKKPKLDTILINRDEADIKMKGDALKRKTDKLKTFRLSSDQLKLLNLRSGRNAVSFICTSRLSGRQVLNADIYLWDSSDKIIISDVDGTITRSDVLGHIMPVFGKDWSHEGVTELYTKINQNGYQILYLTARALCQASTTKTYLQSLFKSNLHPLTIDERSLPEGPILMSPDGLISSFKREIIDKTSQVRLAG